MTIADAKTSGFLSHPIRMHIGGEWVGADHGFDTLNPATGQVIAEVPEASADQVDAAVKAARAAFDDSWRDMAPGRRQKLMWDLAELLEKNAEEFAMLEVLDNGKPISEAEAVDIPLSVEILRYYAGWCNKITGDVLPTSIPQMLSLRRKEPLGVVGAIAPWNFPLLEMLYKVGPALAAGCTVVGKPAEWTPLSTLRFAELAVEAGFPPGVLNIVTGGADVGRALVAHPDVDKIAFTGQTETGQEIMRSASGTLKSVSLELGGKSPNVIFADAPRQAAMAGAFGGVFFNQGQACVAGSRLIIEASIAESFAEELAEKAGAIHLGSGMDRSTEMGPLITSTHRESVRRHIEVAREEGARIRVGGDDAKVEGHEGGFFFQPTVIDSVTNEMSSSQNEIFGPVVSILTFSDFDELVAIANDVRYGLAAGVWTSDVNKALKFADAVEAGTVWINTYGMFDVAVPFGGHKMSGQGGRELGEEALEAYLKPKSIWIDLDAAVPSAGQSVSR